MKLIKLLIIGLFALQLVYADTRGSGNVDDEDDKIIVPASSSKNGIGNMLMQSISLIGIPYRWGGNTPETGMDCSAFIRYVFKKSLGIDLPRTSAEIARRGKKIHISQLEPGDLIFFNTKRGANTHIGMYIGDNKFIQAPRTGQNIQITELAGYYRANYSGAKRIVQENEDEQGQTTIESYHEINDQRLTGGPSHHPHHKKSQLHHGKKSSKSHVAKTKTSKAHGAKSNSHNISKTKQHKKTTTTATKKHDGSHSSVSKKPASAKTTTKSTSTVKHKVG